MPCNSTMCRFTDNVGVFFVCLILVSGSNKQTQQNISTATKWRKVYNRK